MSRALVTGATAGIGAAFARRLAADGFDLVLVARDETRLLSSAAELTQQFGVSVEIIAADLHSPTGITTVESRVAQKDDPIDFLVNNAGFGLRGSFEDNPLDDELRLLQLLVEVPLRLTHSALSQMLPRGSGTIVNIASVAGFVPRGTYGAAKAWVLSFSRSANLEYRRRGITVTAVAPGFVNTEFHQRMRVRTDTVPKFLWLDADRLVALALRDIRRGRPVSIPTLRYKLVVGLSRVLPASVSASGSLRNE